MNTLTLLETIQTNASPAVIFPIITLFCLGSFFFYYKKITQPLAGTIEWIERALHKPQLTFFLGRHSMERKDIAPLAGILAAFSFLAIFNLGDHSAPQSFLQFSQERRYITVEFSEPEEISSMMFYPGLWTGHYTLEFSEDGVNWLKQGSQESHNANSDPPPAMNQRYSDVFKWHNAVLSAERIAVKYIRISSSNIPMELGEIALFDRDGSLIPLSGIMRTDAPELFDEQHLIPDMQTHLNSMYFDEIYHGRTALEHLRGVEPYEISHPPLGKLIIAASISIFGMTPFGWRFSGAVFGVGMIAVMYIFIKTMFGKTGVAAAGTVLLGFDFMRFVQTRISTIDTYGVFFILLSYLFMYRYVTTDPDAPFRKSLTPLALSGISFGLGCASKWIVTYAGIGLAVLYFMRLVMLGKHRQNTNQTGFGKYLRKTLLFSALFFLVAPAVIYCLSYIPYGTARGMSISDGMLINKDFYKIIWNNQLVMFDYHSRLIAKHTYSSQWWQWILNARPILYMDKFIGNMRSAIAAFGNPVVWWGGFVAMIVMAVRAFKYRDGKAMFILIGYLSQLLPWVAVTRIVFIYHYFPSTLFLILALSHIFNTIIVRKQGKYKSAVCGYAISGGVLFAMFYPVLSGMHAPHWYFRLFLRWIHVSWPF